MTMMKHWSLVTITLAAFLAFGLGDVALAKQGRGRGRDDKIVRVNEKIGLEVVDTTEVAPRHARLRVRRKKASRSEMRVQLSDAQPGFTLDIWFQDADGAMTRVGALRGSEDSDGDASYSWRVRTQKGDALPFGVSDVADLSGRDFEVRNGSSVVVRGTVPSLAAAPVSTGKRAEVRTALASSGGEFAVGDDSIQAEIRARRRNGREDFQVEVENAVAGLSLSVYVADAAGAFQFVGDMDEKAAGAGAEYELEIESEHEALPLGVASLSELAGRAIEVRTADGEVIASGFVPQVGEQSTADDGSGDDSSDGTDASDDDADRDEDDHTAGDDDADADADAAAADDDDDSNDV